MVCSLREKILKLACRSPSFLQSRRSNSGVHSAWLPRLYKQETRSRDIVETELPAVLRQDFVYKGSIHVVRKYKQRGSAGLRAVYIEDDKAGLKGKNALIDRLLSQVSECCSDQLSPEIHQRWTGRHEESVGDFVISVARTMLRACNAMPLSKCTMVSQSRVWPKRAQDASYLGGHCLACRKYCAF